MEKSFAVWLLKTSLSVIVNVGILGADGRISPSKELLKRFQALEQSVLVLEIFWFLRRGRLRARDFLNTKQCARLNHLAGRHDSRRKYEVLEIISRRSGNKLLTNKC